MTIQEMFEREDIYSIIETTLEEYYQKVHNKKISVRICKKHLFKKMVIYPRLGIIVPLLPSWSVIKRTYVSFDVQNNLPKKLFAWAYITLCFMTFGLFADASVSISDKTVYTKGTVIIPCNRKIRIYEYGKGYVDAILKNGFNTFYFNNEINMRKKTEYDFILGIADYGTHWYREKLLQGRCLVRCGGKKYQYYINQTIDDLKRLYMKYRVDTPACEYANNIFVKYEKVISEIAATKHIKCADKLQLVLKNMVDICCRKSENIPLTLTHGDLQTGNIYIDKKNNKLYIIDWETVNMRSIWYDAATLMCSTRRANNFSSMINSRFEKKVQESIFALDDITERDMNYVSAVLILEELAFFLDEIADLPGEIGSEIIGRYEREIDKIEWKTLCGNDIT